MNCYFVIHHDFDIVYACAYRNYIGIVYVATIYGYVGNVTSTLGLGLLCFLNCLLCFGAMLQYSSYYAQIMLHKLTLCSKK